MAKESQIQREIGYKRLVFQAIPEMWGFQILIGIIAGFFLNILSSAIVKVANFNGVSYTTANIGEFIFNWRFPVVAVLAVVMVFFVILTELFSQIYLCDDILKGRQAGVKRSLYKGFLVLRKFGNPWGILTILYITIAVPLCGIGFSVSLTRSLYIPNFIMDFVLSNTLYTIAYLLVIILLAWVGYHSVFTLHGVLIDGMTPAEARRHSVRLVKEHRFRFMFGMVRLLIGCFLITFLVNLVLNGPLVEMCVKAGADFPKNVRLDLSNNDFGGLSVEEASALIFYRCQSAFVVFFGSYINYIVTMLCGSYIMLRFTRYYLEYTGALSGTWLERPKKSHYFTKLFLMIVSVILFVIAAAFIGFGFDEYVRRPEPVKIIAHRAGGTMASENSNEGLLKAIEHKCYASEIDTQRTADGYYIINHDNDFARLTGVSKAPQDMTLEEIKKLKIKDTTGSGKELSVPMLSEQLDIIKGHEKLFIELKGATADRQMVDDVVQMVREKDCVDEVALISLGAEVINYAESTYPEFETGVLFFAGIGDVSKLNCDLLIMEEEMATPNQVNNIHNAGKQAIVWTVNTEYYMDRFLDSNVDAIITDEVELAEQVERAHAERTDYEVIRDWFNDGVLRK